MYIIEKNIPVSSNTVISLIDSMEIWDSFLFPIEKKSTMWSSASRVGREKWKKFYD